LFLHSILTDTDPMVISDLLARADDTMEQYKKMVATLSLLELALWKGNILSTQNDAPLDNETRRAAKRQKVNNETSRENRAC